MAVLSPFRPDLVDGTRIRIEQNKQAPAPQDAIADATADQVPNGATLASRSPSPASADPDNAVISTAISAHIDSVVNDARRNAAKFGAGR
jgi:hypothetical protein